MTRWQVVLATLGTEIVLFVAWSLAYSYLRCAPGGYGRIISRSYSHETVAGGLHEHSWPWWVPPFVLRRWAKWCMARCALNRVAA